MLRFLCLLALLSSLVSTSWGQQVAPQQDPELVLPSMEVPAELRKPAEAAPWIVRWMVHPRKRGMFLNLPVIDTDPNRGTTLGLLAIWVIPGKDSDRIEHIHAPSLTYNRHFKTIPTYRYYYYPTGTASFSFRASVSELSEREVFALYEDKYLLGSQFDFYFRGQYNVDGSNRFFGFGPDSAKSNESDYTEDYLGYDVALGLPIISEETHWRIRALNHFVGEKFYGGKISTIHDITEVFPGLVVDHRQQDNESRATLEYDSRDSAVTTSRGAYLNTFIGWSVDSFASAFDYTRYGMDARYFYPWGTAINQTTAARVKYDQVLGDAPFWLQSRLGGKYSQRAYGDGRFIDRGALTSTLEQRFIVHQIKLSGVTTQFEVAPFIGLGEAFDNPQKAAARYARPVYGTAFRAIARPQVVGSVDFGIGQEGLAVFMDINYSF